jgi:predicted RNA-binding protein
LEGYGLEGIATQVFFIEVDDAKICEYDVVGSFNNLEGFEVTDHFLSRG